MNRNPKCVCGHLKNLHLASGHCTTKDMLTLTQMCSCVQFIDNTEIPVEIEEKDEPKDSTEMSDEVYQLRKELDKWGRRALEAEDELAKFKECKFDEQRQATHWKRCDNTHHKSVVYHKVQE